MRAKLLPTFSGSVAGCAACCLAFLSGAAIAQTEDRVSDQLSSSRDVNLYYSERRDRFWRDNAEKLAAIDQEYRDAIEALSAENVERIRAISGNSATRHKALAEDGLKGGERSAASARIQSETATARAELQDWYAAERKAISDRHAEQRAAQIAENRALVEALSAQQKETLQRVIDAPVALTTLDRFPVMSNDPAVPSIPSIPSVAEDTSVALGAGESVADRDLLGGAGRAAVPPGVEPPPERPPQALDCVWGDCPDYEGWGRDRPPMQCVRFDSGEYDRRLMQAMAERLRGARVRINADPAAGEMSFIEVGGEKTWTEFLAAPVLVHEQERALNEDRDKIYYVHDINSTRIHTGDVTVGSATSPYFFQVDFEANRSELKGYCPDCIRIRRDSAARDSQFGAGSNNKRPWSWAYRLSLTAKYWPDGDGTIALYTGGVQIIPPSSVEEPGWDLRRVRPRLKDFAERVSTQLERYVGHALANRAFGLVAADTLFEMTGVPRGRLYYIAYTQPPSERKGYDDIWQACYRP